MTSANVRFSIVMATYNGVRFLQEQLDSLARQSALPDEMVVCDDASTDATVPILEKFRSTAPFPVRVLRNEQNCGYGETFLRAAQEAQSEWLAFCDQDDVWLDHKLSRCAEVLARYGHVDLLSHSAAQVDKQLRPLPWRAPDHRRWRVRGPLTNRPFSGFLGFSCCVRKQLMSVVPVADRPLDSNHPERKQAHDTFIYHVANTYGHVAVLPDSLALYRRHEGTASGPPGSGVYDRSVAARLKSSAYAQEGGFLRLAEEARRHGNFYRMVVERAQSQNAGETFLARSHAAVSYYEFVARAFATRGRMYAQRAPVADRVAALVRGTIMGTYTRARGGAGLRALGKDVLRCSMLTG